MLRELPSLNPLPPEVEAAGRLLEDLAAFAGTAALRTVDELLEQIEGEYLQRFRAIAASDLERHQGALAQVTALREAIAGHNNGRI